MMAVLAIFAALLAFGRVAPPASAAPGQVWLAVSDIHLDLFDRSSRPSQYGLDSNVALFKSTVAQMKRTVPDPAVVLLTGDLLMHNFHRHVRGSASEVDAAALESMRAIASTLGDAFPKSQFAIALGNNDVACGDYRTATGSRYLAEVARAFKPLVDRNGAAPDFEGPFLRGGYYTATLPLPHLRLIALNTVPFSTEYGGNCPAGPSPATEELTWLKSVLRETPPGTRNIVLMHIPPGYDAFATLYIQGLIPWPFLQARYQSEMLDLLQSSGSSILYTIAGHTHRFDFRVVRGMPVIVLGALSPIYDNNPTFYTLRLASDGSLRDIDLHAFDDARLSWLPARSFDQMWGVPNLNARTLAQLHERIGASPALRAQWNRQAGGWSSSLDTSHDPWGLDWRAAWCAQTVFGNDYAQCAGIEGRLRWLILAAFLAAVLVAVLVLVVRRRPRT